MLGKAEVAVAGRAVSLGDKAAATAATAAGLDAMAARSSGDRVLFVDVVEVGVLGGPEGRPEWSIVVGSGTGEIGRIPETGAVELVAVAGLLEAVVLDVMPEVGAEGQGKKEWKLRGVAWG